jgi:biotin operon repressor
MDLSIDTSGPNPMVVFPTADAGQGVSGHLYPGTPSENGPTIHLVVPDTLDAARARLTGRWHRAQPRHRDPARQVLLRQGPRRQFHRAFRDEDLTERVGRDRLRPMRRAERLFRIIEKLRPGRLMTARDLATSLEVSERTIYRDIAHLVGSGLPIEGEAGVGYLMREGYDLPPVMFSEEEMVALTAGARMVAAWGGSSMARGAESALEKIAAVVPDAVRARAERLSLHAWGGIPQGSRHPRHDRRHRGRDGPAASRPHRLYRRGGRASDRVVRPLGLWFWGKVWTLVAWCELARRFPDVPDRPDHGDRRAGPLHAASRSGPRGLLPQRGARSRR